MDGGEVNQGSSEKALYLRNGLDLQTDIRYCISLEIFKWKKGQEVSSNYMHYSFMDRFINVALMKKRDCFYSVFYIGMFSFKKKGRS